MKGKAIIPLALGLCIGLIAVKIGVDAIKKARGSGVPQETVEIAVAKVDIDIYQEITTEMVELIEAPESRLAPASDRIAKLEDLVGRVTAKAIPQKAPILRSMLALPGTPAGLLGRIPHGYRAVSVQIDEVTGVAYQIKPGYWVDVVVAMEVATGNRGRRKETISGIMFRNVQVAAIGQETAGQQTSGSARAKVAKSATLLIAEDEVSDLHLAARKGSITLAMRGFEDSLDAKSGLVRDTAVFEALIAQGKPEPVKKVEAPRSNRPIEPEPEPDPSHSVLVFHGVTRIGTGVGPSVERVTFENANSTHIIGVDEGAAGNEPSSLRSRGARRSLIPVRRATPSPHRDMDTDADTDADHTAEDQAE